MQISWASWRNQNVAQLLIDRGFPEHQLMATHAVASRLHVELTCSPETSDEALSELTQQIETLIGGPVSLNAARTS